MKFKYYFLTILIVFIICPQIYSVPINPYMSDTLQPIKLSGMKLVFNEEFNRDGDLNSEIWSFETGFKRNEELQWYQPKNALCRNGCLVIEGRKELFSNPDYNYDSKNWRENRREINYTSASVSTLEKRSWLFGRFEVRARIDTTMGSWPAIWTLGINNEWPSCGEIDMLEFYRPEDVPSILANVASGTSTRYKPKWNSIRKTLSSLMKNDNEWPQKFHVWRMDWSRDSINLYVDNELLNTTLLSQTINADGSNPFLQPHYLLLNLALGVNGGDPSQSHFPITFEVDYVRIYQRN